MWPRPGQRTAHTGWVFHPGTGEWAKLPPIPSDLAPAIVSIEWAGDRLVVGGGLPAGTADSPERFVLWQLLAGADRWDQIELDVVEPRPCECNLGSQTLLWTGAELFVHLGALASGLSPDGALWAIDLETGDTQLYGTGPRSAHQPVTMLNGEVLWRDGDGAVFVDLGGYSPDDESSSSQGTDVEVERDEPPSTAPGTAIVGDRISLAEGVLPTGFEIREPRVDAWSVGYLIDVEFSKRDIVVFELHDPAVDWSKFGSEGDPASDDTSYFAVDGNDAVGFRGAEGLFAVGADDDLEWSAQWGLSDDVGIVALSPNLDLGGLRSMIDTLRFDDTGLLIDRPPRGATVGVVPSALNGIFPGAAPGTNREAVTVGIANSDADVVGIDLGPGDLGVQSDLLALLADGVVQIVPLVGPDGATREVRFAEGGVDQLTFSVAAWQHDAQTVATVWGFGSSVDVLDLVGQLELR